MLYIHFSRHLKKRLQLRVIHCNINDQPAGRQLTERGRLEIVSSLDQNSCDKMKNDKTVISKTLIRYNSASAR